MENELTRWLTPEAAEELIHTARKYRNNIEFLEKNHNQFMEMYQGEWIAIDGRNLVAHSPTYEELFQVLDEANINRQTSVIRHLQIDPPPLNVTPYSFKVDSKSTS